MCCDIATDIDVSWDHNTPRSCESTTMHHTIHTPIACVCNIYTHTCTHTHPHTHTHTHTHKHIHTPVSYRGSESQRVRIRAASHTHIHTHTHTHTHAPVMLQGQREPKSSYSGGRSRFPKGFLRKSREPSCPQHHVNASVFFRACARVHVCARVRVCACVCMCRYAYVHAVACVACISLLRGFCVKYDALCVT